MVAHALLVHTIEYKLFCITGISTGGGQDGRCSLRYQSTGFELESIAKERVIPAKEAIQDLHS